MYQIEGAAQFPCPRPWGGRGGFMGTAQIFPLYLVVESPNAILTEWTMSCNVVRLHMIGYFTTSTIWRAR